MAYTSKYTGAEIDAKLDSVDTTSLEKIVAAGMTDLDSRVKKLVGTDEAIKADITSLEGGIAALQNEKASKTEVSEADENITTEIKSNERVTAAAINNLYETKADKAYVDDAIISAITNTINASY